MIVLDTTVLVYAVGLEHPLREPCRQIVAAVGAGRLAATTTVEVIQEFAHVRARRSGRQDAASTAAGYADLLSPLLAVSEDDVHEGLRLYAALAHLGAFDAVLAASAKGADAMALVSADRAFSRVPGLRHLEPGDVAAPGDAEAREHP